MTDLHLLPDPEDWPEPVRREYQPPEWAYWTNLADMPLEAMVCLSLGLDPHQCLVERDPPRGIKMLLALSRYYSRQDIAVNHARAGTLVTAGSRKYRVANRTFVEWAQGLNPPWDIPAELQQAAQGIQPAQEPATPVAEVLKVLDEEHPCFAPELAAAVRAWLQLYGNGDEITAKKHRGPRREAVVRGFGVTNKEALQRLATVINPQVNKR